MKSFVYPIIIVIAAFFLSSCEEIWLDCIEGKNNAVVFESNISTFDEIIVTGPFDVYVTKADSFALRINAEENLIPEIKTRIVGKKLYVETEDNHCLRNNLPINIYVSTDNLKEAKLTGSGLIEIDSVDYDYFNITSTGSGDIEVKNITTGKIEVKLTGSGEVKAIGTADESEIDLMGSGDIRFINLVQKTCSAITTGSGDTYVHVTNNLNATITGSGDIYYKGSPSVESNITGSGKLRQY